MEDISIYPQYLNFTNYSVADDVMIQFHSNNFMLKKTINRMAFKNYVPKPLSLVNVLDSDDNFMRYYDSYSDDLEESVNKNGIFLVLASMEHNMFKRAKRIRFCEECPDECLMEFMVTTRNHRNLFLIPEWQCPNYMGLELFGMKIRKVGDEFKLTYGLMFKEFYDIEFNRGYEDIEIIYTEELNLPSLRGRGFSGCKSLYES